MNTVSGLKLVAFFSRVALVALAAFLLGLAANVAVPGLFAFATVAQVLLVAAGDYAHRPRGWQPRRGELLEFSPAPVRSGALAKFAA